MGRPPAKPKKQPPKLPEAELKIYELIKSREGMGILRTKIKPETFLQDSTINKALKSLQSKNLIKDVVDIRYKKMKTFMAVEFEPAKEVSGGSWYSNGSLDTDFINALRVVCMKSIRELKVATIEMIRDSIRNSRVFTSECSTQQVEDIVQLLVLDKQIEEVKSSGIGDFSGLPIGKTCYRCSRDRQVPEVGTLTSVPCGVCPMINECTPDGIISPNTCVYYRKWLEVDF